MKTLPKLSEYVKNCFGNKETILDENQYFVDNVWNYTNFITQPLNLSHFVPTIEKDGKWIVLGKPNHPISDNITEEGLHERYKTDCQEYQTALDNVVFKGCEVKGRYLELSESGEQLFYLDNRDNWVNDNSDFKTIEDLIPYNLEVNETIIKKFGL